MALRPELRKLHEKWHARGLEIRGVRFERDVETVRKACKRKGMTWPQVLVPEDESKRELWQKASGITSIPRVLLIDHQGILQADSSDKLEDKIAKLLAGRSEKAPAKPKP